MRQYKNEEYKTEGNGTWSCIRSIGKDKYDLSIHWHQHDCVRNRSAYVISHIQKIR